LIVLKYFHGMDRYQYSTRLGEGISSVVFKALDRQRNEHVALKTIELENEEEGVPSTALREIAILNRLHHPNIIGLRDVVHHEKKLVIALEYVKWNLRQYCDQFELMPSIIQNIMRQLFDAINYCHENNVVHRDLKPHNILIGENQQIKLADFGLSRELGIYVRTCTSEVVTLWYRSPDVLCGNQHYGKSVDMWSLGCILAELASPEISPPFSGSDPRDTLRKIFELLGSPTPDNWEQAETFENYAQITADFEHYEPEPLEEKYPKLTPNGLDLLLQCWRYDHTRRIKAPEAMKHPYWDDKEMDP